MFYLKSNALPRPRTAEVLPEPGRYEPTVRALLSQKKALARELGHVNAQLEHILFSASLFSASSDDPQDVELYKGNLGVTRRFVNRHERPVGQLQWLGDLPERFNGPDENPGDVNGERWGTGALIGDDLFLTAGHCFDQYPPGWQVPSRFDIPIPPYDLAKLMRVNFNYQVDGKTGKTRPGVPFPVVALLEYRNAGVDYAIVRLGPDAKGRGPTEIFGHLTVAQADLTTIGAMLCIIQHPTRQEKKIEAGPLTDIRAGRIAYDRIDTAGGSSGAPVLSPTGEIVGVHLKGGAHKEGGFNSGAAIGAIREASPLLRNAGAGGDAAVTVPRKSPSRSLPTGSPSAPDKPESPASGRPRRRNSDTTPRPRPRSTSAAAK